VAASLLAGIGATVAWLAGRRVEVRGPSMLPTLADGERLLVRRTRRVRPGDLVVVRDPDDPGRLLVKRLLAREGSRLWLGGDNPRASRDSRAFGPVGRDLLVGVAWYRYAPSSAAGRLARPAREPRGERAQGRRGALPGTL